MPPASSTSRAAIRDGGPTRGAGQTSVEEQSDIVLITGATSGFGRGGTAFRRCGMVADSDWAARERLTEAEELSQRVRVHTAVLDVRDEKAVQSVIDELPEAFRRVKTLVNNAGLALAPQLAQDVDLADWHTMIDTNIKGLVNVTHAVLPTLIETGAGASIVNLGPVAGQWPIPAATSTAKGLRPAVHLQPAL